jgi:hypothetical protein
VSKAELPDSLLARIDKEAKACGITKALLVRDSIEKALRHIPPGPSCYELARDLAGAMKGLPRDLADNPKYTEAFGDRRRPSA